MRDVTSKRTARALAAVIVAGLGLVVAFAGSSTTAGTKTAGNDFRRLTSGGATKGSAAPVSGRRPEIKHGARVAPTVFKGSVRTLPHVAPVRELLPEREAPEVSAGQKQALPGAEAPSRAVTPASSAPAPSPTVSFNGLDKATFGAGFPPDTVGDVGPDHFVQAVNTSIGIFSKTGGAPLAAFTFNSLWATAGTGTLCDTTNQGDPTVIYDPKGGRWFVADFAFSGSGTTPPFYECIAVSKTSDPVAGGWYFYAIRTDDASHPWLSDYPKMGIWPDGLYMTANMFQGNTFEEVRVWAFNRSDLEAGLPVRNVVVDLASPEFFSLMPSNMRTAAGVPPAGRENLLVSESGTLFSFEVWKFHADFVGSGSTFSSLPINVSQTTYTVAASTVPTPANSLDSLPERMMMQSQYTNIGGVESLWVNHTVRCCGAGSPAGIQWSQINVTGGSVVTTPIQQQLYPSASDTLHRWMGSLAVDQDGDVALGYSVANATTNPDIRYAGRLAGDTLNTLPQTETSMLTGVTLGSQSGNCGGGTCTRWGDYSAMTLDPDGCRYWYTQEYYGTTGLNWLTRIGSFSFPSCTAKAYQTITFGALAGKTFGDPDFTVSATASSGLPVSFSASGNCTISGSTVHLAGAGSCTVTASQAGDATHANAPDVSQTFAIAKASQAITFAALPDKTIVDADFSVSATASSGLTVSLAASGNCTVSGSTVHLTGVGSCTITASQSGDSNYNAASAVSQTFSITKANQTITFSALGAKTFGAADFAVSATASSGLAVSLAASGNCTLSGTTVHITGAGSCTLTASQAGDATYNAAADVLQTFAIAKASQTIAFGALVNKIYGAANFRVSAKASSDLAVAFSASGRCTVSGSTVHITGVGSCMLTASQAGNANYAAAANVLRRSTIFPKPCTVPKVTGKRLVAAKSALARRHCRVGKVRHAYSAKKKGVVSSQSRRPGRILPASSKINLVLSHGPRP